jgi:hypothetical protein
LFDFHAVLFAGCWPGRFKLLRLPVLMLVSRLIVMLLSPPQFVPYRPPFHAAPIAAPQMMPVANAAPGAYG